MMIKVGDFIAKYLHDVVGIDVVFLMTGTGSIYLDDGLAKIEGIRKIAFRNEATGAMMAEAFARLRKTIGVVYVTTGPAGVNALSGVAESWVDSTPVLIISGQVDQKYSSRGLNIRNFGTQELDILSLAKPITKYCAFVDKPDRILYELEKAIAIATDGRQGPVWLDIPLDVQKSMVDSTKMVGYFGYDPNFIELKDTENELINLQYLIDKSERPVIIAGGGIHSSNSEKFFKKFADKHDIPIIFSRMGQDLLPYSHKNNFGHGGMKGTQVASAILKDADLIIGIGSRLSVPFLGEHKTSLSKDVKIVAVDIDQNELEKPFFDIDLKINCDCGIFFHRIKKEIKWKKVDSWVDKCNEYKVKYSADNFIKKQNPIDIYHFVSELDKKSTPNDIFVSDAGTSYFVTGQILKFEYGQREIVSGAFASMGLAIPLAIGSAASEPGKRILAITGDGSLETNIQELRTLSYHDLNVKLFVINNGGYVSIRISQDKFCDGRYINSDHENTGEMLDFSKVADAFELPYYRLDNYKTLSGELGVILEDVGPALIEVVCDPNQIIMQPLYEY